MKLSDLSFFLCAGIYTFPWNADRWHKRGNSWIFANTDCQCDFFEYLVTAITRIFNVKGRAEKYAKVLRKALIEGKKLVLAFHSNGINVFNNSLKLKAILEPHLFDDTPIEKIVITAGAIGGDFEKSLVYEYFLEGKIKRIDVIVAGKDRAMTIAKYGKRLGFGTTVGTMTEERFNELIRDQPFEGIENRGEYHIEPEFGHSTFHEDEHFDAHMQMIMKI